MIYQLFDQDSLVMEVEGDFMHSNLEGVATIFYCGEAVALLSLTDGQVILRVEEEEEDDYDEDGDDEDEVTPGECFPGCPDCAAEREAEAALEEAPEASESD